MQIYKKNSPIEHDDDGIGIKNRRIFKKGLPEQIESIRKKKSTILNW